MPESNGKQKRLAVEKRSRKRGIFVKSYRGRRCRSTLLTEGRFPIEGCFCTEESFDMSEMTPVKLAEGDKGLLPDGD